VEYDDHRRYHEALHGVTSADVRPGRWATILARRARITHRAVQQQSLKGSMGTRCVGIIVVVVGLGSLSARPGSAQAAASEDGRQLFLNHCASCHGVTGQGNGPLAPALRRAPTDLTQLALTNGGVFPDEHVRRIIDGREVVSHGDPEMPVWGDVFKTPRDGFREAAVSARIAAIVAYLASIQRRLAH